MISELDRRAQQRPVQLAFGHDEPDVVGNLRGTLEGLVRCDA